MTDFVPIKGLFEPRRDTVDPAEFADGEVFHYSLPVWHETRDGRIEAASDLASLKQIISGGEILVSKLNPEKGAVLHAEPKLLPIVASTEFIVLRPRNVHERFGYWLMQSQAVRDELCASVESVTNSHKRARVDRFLATHVQVPSLAEQARTARHLDRETSRIDALIEKKQRLIELLEEKRQAVITEAVTRGLDPDLPTKDSGVEWLGSIPNGWALSELRFVVTSRGGGTPDKSYEEYWGGDVLWVSPKDMKRPVIDTSIDRITEDAVAASAVKMVGVGAVLVVVRGMILAHSFPVAVAGKQLTLNQDMKALVADSRRLSGAYLYWLLIGLREVVLSLTDSSAHGTKTLPFGEFLRMAVPLPPLAEQDRIAGFLNERVGLIDALLGKIKESIALLSERRSSLITAAVTGQIDITDAA